MQMNLTNPLLKAEFPQVKWEEYEVSGGAGRQEWIQMMTAHNHPECLRIVPIIMQKRKVERNQRRRT